MDFGTCPHANAPQRDVVCSPHSKKILGPLRSDSSSHLCPREVTDLAFCSQSVTFSRDLYERNPRLYSLLFHLGQCFGDSPTFTCELIDSPYTIFPP